MFRIQEVRKSIGLTQKQLAERVNTTREYISAIENNRKTPSFDLLERIAKELNTSMKNLIDDVA